MSYNKKKIAIVGGGLSGLGCIINLKLEGHDPVCFETFNQYGGTWNYREESEVGYASIMSTTTINNSKEMGAVSIFPPPKEFNNYMRHSEMMQYVNLVVKENDLERYIKFNKEVIHVIRADDYEETGRFTVTVKDRVTGVVQTDVFDGVMIATGHFAYPNMLTFPGQDKFKGTIMHTHGLKRAAPFQDKNVLVVGTGCSGLDAAELVSSTAQNVYNSARNGSHIITRQGPNGYPIDYVLMRRYLFAFLQWLPIWLSSWYLETFYTDPRFDHRLQYVKPKYHILRKDPVCNDAFASKLLSGAVVQKTEVERLTEDGVVFVGEDTVTPIDTIILATGYDFKYPFLEDGLLQIEKDGRINLFKCMYPVQLPHNSLVFIGFVNPFGPGIPIGEMQCRLAAHVYSGHCKLPSEDEMMTEVIKRHQENKKRYTPSPINSNRIDFLPYLDDLASMIGCKPNLIKYFFTDLPLFLRLVFGPAVSYHYRLEGPQKWEGARDAIMTTKERVLYPLIKGKKVQKSFLQMIFELIGNAVPKNIFNF